ncbi:MAG: universal stress protein [Formivibrio sp.]|nr:universal stress protein [Formivibrio sp.]
MYQRILVPIDTSTTSHVVLEEVKRMVNGLHAKVCLVTVIDTSQFATSPDELFHELQLKEDQRLRDERREIIWRFLEDCVSDLRVPGIEVETKLVEKFGGKISNAILDEATHWGADLLIMGTHGREGLSHALMGSVAEGVIRHAQIPVLLVNVASDDEYG